MTAISSWILFLSLKRRELNPYRQNEIIYVIILELENFVLRVSLLKIKAYHLLVLGNDQHPQPDSRPPESWTNCFIIKLKKKTFKMTQLSD